MLKSKIELQITPFFIPRKVCVTTVLMPMLIPKPSASFSGPASTPTPQEPAYNLTMGVPLHDLDAEILDELCNQFRRDVFRAAGKKMPVQELRSIREENPCASINAEPGPSTASEISQHIPDEGDECDIN